MSGWRLINLKGLKFGLLTVKRVDKIRSSTITKQKMAWAYWRCLCEGCGCMTSVRSDHLRNGAIRMCDQCSYELRQNRFARLRELRKSIDPEKYANDDCKKRIKRITMPTPAGGIVVHINTPFNSKKALKKIGPLRDTGCAISELMDLFSCTRQQVLEEIAKYRKEQKSPKL